MGALFSVWFLVKVGAFGNNVDKAERLLKASEEVAPELLDSSSLGNPDPFQPGPAFGSRSH